MRTKLETLRDAWAAAWPKALALWSPYARLREPRWCFSEQEAAEEGLTGSFAMIRLDDHGVVVNLKGVEALGLEDYALEVMGHEVGHHIYCPGDLSDQGRMISRLRAALPTIEKHAGDLANIYADLLINNRLQREAGLRMADVYRALSRPSSKPGPLWTLYMRIYELLWGLNRGDLATGQITSALEGDAQWGARLFRAYAQDWVRGSGRFGALCFPYLLNDRTGELEKILSYFHDTRDAAAGGGVPAGLAEMDPDEEGESAHPSEDPALGGVPRKKGTASIAKGGGDGQYREPFEYGQILKSMGVTLSDHDIAVAYYKERALPHLIPFPSRKAPVGKDPLPEGSDAWDTGESLAAIDWSETLMTSPRVIPGVTTRQRVYGTMEGTPPAPEPLDLDLYVDCSGSMPNPQTQMSYLTLAGTIVALSALRAGARVQATLWSGPGQFETTEGFVRDENRILRILTGYLGGSTAFPISLLGSTYRDRKPTDRPAHVLVISDDGVTTMFGQDEWRRSGLKIAAEALALARGGGTWCLNLFGRDASGTEYDQARKMGWKIFTVKDWADLVAFAKAFGRTHYEKAGRP